MKIWRGAHSSKRQYAGPQVVCEQICPVEGIYAPHVLPSGVKVNLGVDVKKTTVNKGMLDSEVVASRGRAIIP